MSLCAADEASMATVKACFCIMVVLHLALVIQQTLHSMWQHASAELLLPQLLDSRTC